MKFRVWDKKEKCWVHPALVALLNSDQSLLVYENGRWNIRVKKDYDIQRSSGLTDKQRKEIYEGDFVQWGSLDKNARDHEYEIRIAEVKINPDIQFDCRNIKPPHIFRYGCFAYPETEKYLTVVGNIFENPELLEK